MLVCNTKKKKDGGKEVITEHKTAVDLSPLGRGDLKKVNNELWFFKVEKP